MKLKKYYSLHFGLGIPSKIKLPLTLNHDGCNFQIMEPEDGLDALKAELEINIDPSKIYLSDEWETISGDIVPAKLVIPTNPGSSNQPEVFVDIISFLGDWQINLASTTGFDEIIPETEEDEKILSEFGTRDIHVDTSMTVAIRTFSMGNIGELELETLIGRQSGLRLYAQALDQRDPVGRFRELWKILEAGFGEQDQDLVDLLSEYQPAVDMEFSQNEIEALHVLRGRASHAGGNAGIQETNT